MLATGSDMATPPLLLPQHHSTQLPGNIATMFNVTGSTLARQSSYEALFSLPDKISWNDTRAVYAALLDALAYARATPAGAAVEGLLMLNATDTGASPAAVIDSFVTAVEERASHRLRTAHLGSASSATLHQLLLSPPRQRCPPSPPRPLPRRRRSSTYLRRPPLLSSARQGQIRQARKDTGEDVPESGVHFGRCLSPVSLFLKTWLHPEASEWRPRELVDISLDPLAWFLDEKRRWTVPRLANKIEEESKWVPWFVKANRGCFPYLFPSLFPTSDLEYYVHPSGVNLSKAWESRERRTAAKAAAQRRTKPPRRRHLRLVELRMRLQ